MWSSLNLTERMQAPTESYKRETAARRSTGHSAFGCEGCSCSILIDSELLASYFLRKKPRLAL